jgi:predicted phage terminase large subunit-like protein
VRREEEQLGPYMASGRLQQAPSPKGGGIIQRDWWQLWDKPNFPDNITHVEISVDTATGEREQNDWNAVTVWGCFEHKGQPSVILMESWVTRAPLHLDGRVAVGWEDVPSDPVAAAQQASAALRRFRERAGLVEQLLECANRRSRQGAASLNILIEDKSRGPDVAREIRRLMQTARYTVELFKVSGRGDKVARLYACQALFAAKMVFAPDKSWADAVIDQVAQVPTAKHDDLADSCAQALITLKGKHLLRMADDVADEKRRREVYQPPTQSVAEMYEY